MMRRVIGGIFVGGASTRMGGRPKGLLEAPGGGALVERWRRLFAGIGAEVVLVGANPAYAHLGMEALADAVEGVGPLGGLVALLERAGDAYAIAVACDMPYVSPALVARLAHAPPATAVAPRSGKGWEPFFARYDARAALALASAHAAAGRSMQSVLDARGTELALTDAERAELRDWDSPGDVR
jgi:molybdopterin-guanine dinucleotide biosynthesis protein A